MPKGKFNVKAATKSPTVKEIAWAAGIYEGEGTSFRVGNKYGPAVHITQKDPWLLYKLEELFGGNVTAKMKSNAYGGKEFSIYRWQAYGPRAYGFLLTIYCFLSPRRKEQAQIALGIKQKA